ncbi:MAG: hypothetical protein RLO51_25950 [Thalassobaculum sp.]
MAKGQKRGNREVRKPKTVKSPVAAATTFLPSRDKPTPAAPAKKKH